MRATHDVGRAQLPARGVRRDDGVRKALAWAGAYGVLTAISLVMLAPFLWMLSTSFKEPQAIFTYPPQLFPTTFKWQNYADVFSLIPFERFYWNSVYISFLVVAGTVFFASLAGYAFAKIPFSGRNAVFLVLLSAMMIPHEVTAIPMFLFMRDLNWIDTHLPLILLPIFGAGGVFGIFVMRQFFYNGAYRVGGGGDDRRLQSVPHLRADHAADCQARSGDLDDLYLCYGME